MTSQKGKDLKYPLQKYLLSSISTCRRVKLKVTTPKLSQRAESWGAKNKDHQKKAIQLFRSSTAQFVCFLLRPIQISRPLAGFGFGQWRSVGSRWRVAEAECSWEKLAALPQQKDCSCLSLWSLAFPCTFRGPAVPAN